MLPQYSSSKRRQPLPATQNEERLRKRVGLWTSLFVFAWEVDGGGFAFSVQKGMRVDFFHWLFYVKYFSFFFYKKADPWTRTAFSRRRQGKKQNKKFNFFVCLIPVFCRRCCCRENHVALATWSKHLEQWWRHSSRQKFDPKIITSKKEINISCFSLDFVYRESLRVYCCSGVQQCFVR